MNRQFVTFCLLLISLNIHSQNLGTISGKVFNNDNGLILEGATIQVEDSDFFAITNSEGLFEIKDIPTSSYNIKASFIGFKSQTIFNVIVKSEGNQSLQFGLNPLSEELDEVILVESPFKTSIETPLSTQTFSAVEIETYPGGNNDITRVIQSLPGISPSVGGFRNDIIIRGGGPNETVYYIDGIEIPNINHFSTQGSSGGPVGLVNISFIKDVTLTTSVSHKFFSLFISVSYCFEIWKLLILSKINFTETLASPNKEILLCLTTSWFCTFIEIISHEIRVLDPVVKSWSLLPTDITKSDFFASSLATLLPVTPIDPTNLELVSSRLDFPACVTAKGIPVELIKFSNSVFAPEYFTPPPTMIRGFLEELIFFITLPNSSKSHGWRLIFQTFGSKKVSG